MNCQLNQSDCTARGTYEIGDITHRRPIPCIPKNLTTVPVLQYVELPPGPPSILRDVKDDGLNDTVGECPVFERIEYKDDGMPESEKFHAIKKFVWFVKPTSINKTVITFYVEAKNVPDASFLQRHMYHEAYAQQQAANAGVAPQILYCRTFKDATESSTYHLRVISENAGDDNFKPLAEIWTPTNLVFFNFSSTEMFGDKCFKTNLKTDLPGVEERKRFDEFTQRSLLGFSNFTVYAYFIKRRLDYDPNSLADLNVDQLQEYNEKLAEFEKDYESTIDFLIPSKAFPFRLSLWWDYHTKTHEFASLFVALHKIHRTGWFHHDLHPGNVFRAGLKSTSKGKGYDVWKFIDFGMSHTVEETLSQAQWEQYHNNNYDKKNPRKMPTYLTELIKAKPQIIEAIAKQVFTFDILCSLMLIELTIPPVAATAMGVSVMVVPEFQFFNNLIHFDIIHSLAHRQLWGIEGSEEMYTLYVEPFKRFIAEKYAEEVLCWYMQKQIV